MAQPDDVRASLLRGDSRDGCARRKVADRVHDVVGREAEEFIPEGAPVEVNPGKVRVVRSRESTFERLANVERLLTQAMTGEGGLGSCDDDVRIALDEVRVLLGVE